MYIYIPLYPLPAVSHGTCTVTTVPAQELRRIQDRAHPASCPLLPSSFPLNQSPALTEHLSALPTLEMFIELPSFPHAVLYHQPVSYTAAALGLPSPPSAVRAAGVGAALGASLGRKSLNTSNLGSAASTVSVGAVGGPGANGDGLGLVLMDPEVRADGSDGSDGARDCAR